MSQPFEASAGGAQAVVQITLGQVYNEVRQTHEAVQGLVQALEPIKSTLGDHETRLRAVDPLPERVGNLEEDVEALGKKVDGLRLRGAMMVGGAIVLGGGVGSVVTVLLSHR